MEFVKRLCSRRTSSGAAGADARAAAASEAGHASLDYRRRDSHSGAPGSQPSPMDGIRQREISTPGTDATGAPAASTIDVRPEVYDGRFLIGWDGPRILGAGSYGRVYVAVDGYAARYVALKVGNPEKRGLVESMNAEATALAAVNHSSNLLFNPELLELQPKGVQEVFNSIRTSLIIPVRHTCHLIAVSPVCGFPSPDGLRRTRPTPGAASLSRLSSVMSTASLGTDPTISDRSSTFAITTGNLSECPDSSCSTRSFSRIARSSALPASPDLPWLAMELIGCGKTLMSLVRHVGDTQSGRLPLEMVRRLFVQCTQAVCECHAGNVAHRDLKCDNFVIDAFADDTSPLIKLVDFGFAMHHLDRSVRLMSHPGTLAFAAPEIISGEPTDPFASDIWALGVILYILCTNHFPFGSKDTPETRRAIRRASPTFNAGHRQDRVPLPTELIALITSLLTVEDYLRPSVVEILETPWVRTPIPLSLEDTQFMDQLVDRMNAARPDWVHTLPELV